MSRATHPPLASHPAQRDGAEDRGFKARSLRALTAALFSPWAWGGFTVLVAYLDLVTGPWIQLPGAFAFPVFMAAWTRRIPLAVALAIGLPLLRPLLFSHGHPGYPLSILLINACVRAVLMLGLVLLTRRLVALSARVSGLERLLPVCAWCRRIRTEEDAWMPLEVYLAEASHASITHGICPECSTGFKKELEVPPVS